MAVKINPKIIDLQSEQMCTFYSQKIDTTAERVFLEMKDCLINTQEHLDRVHELSDQPVLCGSTPPDEYTANDKKKYAARILFGASAFEQFIAVEDWFFRQPLPLSDLHTFCLMNDRPRQTGKSVPISIQKKAQSLLQVMIGRTNSAKNPPPKYLNAWDSQDPWSENKQEQFIYHLEALEIVRQPNSIGATLIKGNAFESEYIDQDWRYGVGGREASVEFRGQKTLNKQKQAIKTQSAAFNLFQLINQNLGDIDLNEHLDNRLSQSLKKFWPENNLPPEHITLEVTPNDLWASLIEHNPNTIDRDSLYYAVFKLMVAKIGPQSTPALSELIRTRLNEAPFTITTSKQQD